MLRDFNKDRITLVKADGQVAKEDIPALVTGDMIFTADQSLPLEVGDHLLRELPNGLVEDYEVTILGVLGHPNFDGLTWRLRPIQVRT